MIDQLKARNASYPIEYNTDPSDSDDANVPWLAPGRLLIFVKYETPIDDTLNITGESDGRDRTMFRDLRSSCSTMVMVLSVVVQGPSMAVRCWFARPTILLCETQGASLDIGQT